MSGRVRTRVDRGTGEIVAYSDVAVRNNSGIIEYCRTSMAALSGATAGIIIKKIFLNNLFKFFTRLIWYSSSLRLKQFIINIYKMPDHHLRSFWKISFH